jgi:hypothetical protein
MTYDGFCEVNGDRLPRALALTMAATNLHPAYQQTSIVMPGLVPGIHVLPHQQKGVDGRDDARP